MLTRRGFLGWTAGALASGGSLLNAHVGQALEVPFAVVVSRNSPILRLSRRELTQLYLGLEVQAPGGERILALHQMPQSGERIGFERQVAGLLPGCSGERRLCDEAVAPPAVTSVRALQHMVHHRVRAVGYVRWDQVGPELRVIPIDGSLPGDHDYPLRAA
ncbi:MAG: hypothetical protein RL685_2216 [Pseudomonadota bacterium]|jgi:hypothetical protein